MRVAIAGVGRVALGQYIPYLRERDDVELALWNRTPEAAVAAARDAGATALPTLAALADWRPDVALVLTSEHARADVATTLIEAGVPRLFFEKPLTARGGQANVAESDFAEGRRMLALAADRGIEVALDFNYRFFSTVARARALLASGELGALLRVSARAHFACWSHTLDLIAWFAGAPARVLALGGEVRSDRGMTGEDLAVAFTTERSVAGTILGGTGGAWDPSLLEITLDCERGRIRLSDLDGGLEVAREGDPHVEVVRLGDHAGRWDRYSASFRAALDAYLASVEAGAAPPVTGLDGLRELQFEAAIRRSLATRAAVEVAEELPL